ncbi:MAG: hypothetical protein ACD_76C00051G0002, partial [uncultured bacterium]
MLNPRKIASKIPNFLEPFLADATEGATHAGAEALITSHGAAGAYIRKMFEGVDAGKVELVSKLARGGIKVPRSRFPAGATGDSLHYTANIMLDAAIEGASKGLTDFNANLEKVCKSVEDFGKLMVYVDPNHTGTYHIWDAARTMSTCKEVRSYERMRVLSRVQMTALIESRMSIDEAHIQGILPCPVCFGAVQ